MKESMWGYLIVVLGISILVILIIVQNLTTTKQQDFYLGKEIAASSIIEAIDYGVYEKTGKIAISKEKFVAIATRRFAESVNPDRTYQLDFYDIHEYPPKITMKISTKTGEAVINDTMLSSDLNQYITQILEAKDPSGAKTPNIVNPF